MDDQKQCCDNGASPIWIYEIDGVYVTICQNCSLRPELKQSAKSAWNISHGEYDNGFLKMEIVA